MIATGGLAFANARIRALKSRLLTADIRRSTRTDPQPSLDLVLCYGMVLDSLPAARPVTLALLARHEIENVKLVWRAVGRGHPIARWSRLFRRLGPLASFSLGGARECTSLAQLAEFLQSTPFREIGNLMWRGHRDDLLAAELGFDRWMSRWLLEVATSLDARETIARGLIESIVVERDLSLLRRSVATYQLSPDALTGTLAFLPQVMSREHITSLAAWTPGQTALVGHWPREWRTTLTGASDWDAVFLRWRSARYRLCARAFLDQPFCLAPAVALLLLVEEEVRAVTALRDARGDTVETPSLRFALAASAVGH